MVWTLKMILNFTPRHDFIKLSYRLSSVCSAYKSTRSSKESQHWRRNMNRSYHTSFIHHDLLKHRNSLSRATFLQQNSFGRVESRMFAGEAKKTGLQFNDSEESLLFDEAGILIKKLTFKDAKLLARSNNSRLVYMNKNKDGMNCFKLEPSNTATRPLPNPAFSKIESSQNMPTKETSEDSSKEFVIKSVIKEHDLSIKTNKIKSLLSKGKSVSIIVQHAASEDGKVNQSLAKKLMEELKTSGQLKNESSRKTNTRFKITPLEKQSS